MCVIKGALNKIDYILKIVNNVLYAKIGRYVH